MDMFWPGGVIGTKRWIGATETWALFAGLGIRSKIVDFDDDEHQSAGDKMIAWLLNYFIDDSSSTQTSGNSDDVTVTKDCDAAGCRFTSNPWIRGVEGDEPCVAWARARARVQLASRIFAAKRAFADDCWRNS
jgi:hypothetical protein